MKRHHSTGDMLANGVELDQYELRPSNGERPRRPKSEGNFYSMNKIRPKRASSFGVRRKKNGILFIGKKYDCLKWRCFIRGGKKIGQKNTVFKIMKKKYSHGGRSYVRY